jgi:hypothetical protein
MQENHETYLIFVSESLGFLDPELRGFAPIGILE